MTAEEIRTAMAGVERHSPLWVTLNGELRAAVVAEAREALAASVNDALGLTGDRRIPAAEIDPDSDAVLSAIVATGHVRGVREALVAVLEVS